MKFRHRLLILLVVVSAGLPAHALACSTYKITVGGKTMYGINYDTWLEHPRIWFETNGYGAAFTGANDQGGSDFTPQSGMNEYRLAFGTLATAAPSGRGTPGKKPVESRSRFLKGILHTCKNVDEVRAYVEQYDRSLFSNDVFFYTDRSGRYLVVEPYQTIAGQEDRYVLANFCPSTITDFSTIKQERYRNGVSFLKDKIDTSLAFCTALSDTMHVCRPGIGDGTLLTSIWDLERCEVSLYFYHDYRQAARFNLAAELAKGDHVLEIPALFPTNAEYRKLVDYQTPLNSKLLAGLLWCCTALFAFSFCWFLTGFLRNRKAPFAGYKPVLAGLGLSLGYLLLSLQRDVAAFYFPAPYQSHQSGLRDAASYLPFVLLALIVPLLITNAKVIRTKAWRPLSTVLFVANNLAYLLLIALFFYWGFYQVWGRD